MKKSLLALACLALAAPALASKSPRIAPHVATGGAPTTVTISSTPLTIVVGSDTSTQVYNSNVPGEGQYYPPDCNPGETADNGIFVSLGGLVYGPDFSNHPCGSASNSYTPWTQVSMTPVSGTGTSGDPYTVVIVVTAGATGLQLTETLTYVTGQPGYNASLAFSNVGQAALTWDTFHGSDLYLADNDDGFALQQGTSIGGRGANSSCLPLQYVILFQSSPAADRYAAEGFGEVWDEISAGNLSNTVESATCQDNGAAIEWTDRSLNPGASLTLGTGVSFTGSAVPQGAAVPTLSTMGLAALILALALIGYAFAGRISPGA
jgi:hypothetical protein